MAQQTKKTPGNQKRIVKLLEMGVNRKDAYDQVGISHTVFYEWLKEDENFAAAIAAAESKFRTSLEAMGLSFAFGVKADPEKGIEGRAPSESMVRFMLSHRMPDVYGQKATIKLDKVEEMTDEELLAAAALILGGEGGAEGNGEEGPLPQS